MLPGGQRVSVKAFRAYQVPHGKEWREGGRKGGREGRGNENRFE